MYFREQIEKHRQEMISNLQGCIRIPSVYTEDDSGHPYGLPLRRCLDYMLELAASMGFATHDMDGQVGWCEYGEGEEMVAVLGHLDVVPEGDGWTVEPYGGEVKDGRIYGRGSMDDKGPVMAALYALLAIKEAGVPLRRRIRLLFGTNEESGSADMKYYTAHGGELPVLGITPDGEYPVINGEKGLVTEFFEARLHQTGPIRLAQLRGGSAHNIVPAHAWARLVCPGGMAEEIAARRVEKIACALTEDGVRVAAEGVSAHGGTPQEGENAIGRLMRFLNELPLEGELAAAVKLLAEGIGMEWDGSSLGVAMADEVSGPFTMNLGVAELEGETLRVKTNYRYPVTRTFEACGPAIEAAFAAAGFAPSHFLHKQRIYMEPDSPLVRTLMEVYQDYTGQADARPKCIGGGTYAKMMPNTLAFGPVFPGDEVREHKPDEFMEIDRLVDNANILAAAMYELAK